MGKFGDFVKKIGLDVSKNLDDKQFAEKFFKENLYDVEKYIYFVMH